jgi:hypothetical protein
MRPDDATLEGFNYDWGYFALPSAILVCYSVQVSLNGYGTLLITTPAGGSYLKLTKP